MWGVTIPFLSEEIRNCIVLLYRFHFRLDQPYSRSVSGPRATGGQNYDQKKQDP